MHVSVSGFHRTGRVRVHVCISLFRGHLCVYLYVCAGLYLFGFGVICVRTCMCVRACLPGGARSKEGEYKECRVGLSQQVLLHGQTLAGKGVWLWAPQVSNWGRKSLYLEQGSFSR